jgi:hypothetical protein
VFQRTPLTGHDRDGPGDRTHRRHGVQDDVAAAADGQDRRRERGRGGERQGAGEVEHAEVFGGIVLVRKHVGDEREVDGHVHAEAEAGQGHAEEIAVEGARQGNDDQRHAVNDGRGEDEDLPPADAVRQLAADQ